MPPAEYTPGWALPTAAGYYTFRVRPMLTPMLMMMDIHETLEEACRRKAKNYNGVKDDGDASRRSGGIGSDAGQGEEGNG